MGVLDDAIREHLELKRRHGATDDEISRQSAEALGPARRDAPGLEESRDDDDLLDASDARDLDEEIASEDRTVLLDLPGDESDRTAPHEALAATGDDEPELAEEDATVLDLDLDRGDPERFHEDRSALEDDHDALEDDRAEPFDEDEESSSASDRPAPEDRPDSGADRPSGEDVLEETPDFLQETPEHDRLWFEQKPPRDFDFDE